MTPTRLAVLVSVLCSAGCLSPQKVALQRQAGATRPVCDGAADCAAKWDAAQLWVAQHAGYGIQTATNVVIQTYTSVNSSDTRLMATVTKEPIGSGKYRIVAKLSCWNMSGCSTDPTQATVDFNNAVAAAAP